MAWRLASFSGSLLASVSGKLSRLPASRIHSGIGGVILRSSIGDGLRCSFGCVEILLKLSWLVCRESGLRAVDCKLPLRILVMDRSDRSLPALADATMLVPGVARGGSGLSVRKRG